MYTPNEAKVLEQIGPNDVVLDIGGWALCFNRANYVLDSGEYDTRGTWYKDKFNIDAQGGSVEYFTRDTWIKRDICDKTPWPFADKSIDYVICSQTLEDIRDPIWVCQEMNRVAKRGYIEEPSLLSEMSRGREPGVPVGLCHHAWIVEIRGNAILFYPKAHYIHGDYKLSFPAHYHKSLPHEKMFAWMFWEGSFSVHLCWMSPEDMAAIVRREYPDIDKEVDPEEAIRLELAATRSEVESLKAKLSQYAELSSEADAVKSAAETLRGLLGQFSDLGASAVTPASEVEALRAELDRFTDLGPTSVAIARKLQRVARRHPHLSKSIKRLVSHSV